MTHKLDIIILGASGFTGKYVLLQAYKLFENITWGVAGRNQNKLSHILQETAKCTGINGHDVIPIIYANVEEEDSIRNMTKRAKIIINCCGPFDMYGGETVVKYCIETGTHYVDVSAEELFINNILLKYEKSAEEKGIYIVNLCGFNCISYDMGMSFMEKKFEGILNSMEVYLHSRSNSTNNSSSINYSTWKSVINSMAKYQKLKSMKKQLKQKKIQELNPKITTKLLHKVEYGLALPFPGIDEDTMHRSQLYFYEQSNKRPVQVRSYIIMDSFYTIFITAVLGLLCLILSQFSFGRSLLLKYPEFFSCGTFSQNKPSEDELDKRFYSMIFKGKGWSNSQLNGNSQNKPYPDKEIIGCMSGKNPAYGFTGLSVVLCALMILLEPNNLPARGGIYTPAAAFSKTSLIEQLENNGVKFEITSIRDLE